MLIRSRFFFLALLPCVLAFATSARGQQADTTQLPEIAPREIEIRGERQIALPSLERQPLVGFAAPPKVPAVPPDHRPYTAPYQQELGDLPESLPLPETVSEPLRPPSTPARGFAEGGGGRYAGRFFESRALFPLSAHERLSLHGTYTGIEEDPDADVAEARVRFESLREAVRVGANLHGSAERYALYGADPAPQTGASPDPRRNAFSVGSTLRLQSRGSVPAGAQVRYDHTQYTSHLRAASPSDGLTVREDQLSLHGSVAAPVSLQPRLEADYRHSWFGGDALSETAFSIDTDGTLSFFRSDSSTVEVGATLLATEAPVRLSGPAASADTAYVVPYVDVEWRVAEGLTLHLRNRPRLTEASLHRLYAKNPYARHAPALRPTIETTNAEAGLTLAFGHVRLVAGAGYRYAPSYQSFVPGGQEDYADGLFRVRYDAARILEGRGQIALQGFEGVQASLSVSAREGSLANTDKVLPNFARVTADAMLTVSFAGGDGFLEAQSHFEGPRFASPAQTTRLDPYFTLDLEGSYALAAHLDLLARAEHLAVQTPTQWVGYPRPPAQVSAGLRIHW